MINPATGLPMTLIESLTATEYEKLREERHSAAHAPNAVWSEDELMWIASAGIQTAAPAPAPAPAPVEVTPPVETPPVQAE